MSSTRKFAVIFGTIVSLFCSSTFATPHSVKWCAHWYTKFIDSGYGEDTFNAGQNTFEYSPAKYAKAKLRIAGLPYHWEGNLDSDGCTPLLSTEGNTDYQFHIWYTRFRGGRAIHVNADEFAPDTAYKGLTVTTGNMLSDGGTVNVTYSHWHERTNMAQLAGLALGYPTSRYWPGQSVTYISTQANPACGTGRGTNTVDNKICINTDYVATSGTHYNHGLYKFVIAHEMGHAQSNAVRGPGGNTSPTYQLVLNETTNEHPCNCVATSEGSGTIPEMCFRMRADILSAEREGWANFWSAALLNERSSSNGYMAIWNKTYVMQNGSAEWETVTPIAYNMLSREKYMEAECDPEDASGDPADNVGILSDWSQFFWELWTKTSDRFDMNMISPIWLANYQEYDDTNEYGHWDTLLETVEQLYASNYEIHFEDTGDLTGVNH
ncbi:MAG: hypothetical protein JXX29_14930 [Deltaproteobacteria bacterium]|nr:hypothetical protein [Deltaproteobacteria bacterium]MBN2672974.1 hypothetical protein [Deltaproteobacteria bacterium]